MTSRRGEGTADDQGATRFGKVSGRYRKVEIRTWGDEKFRSLSPIPPCGQGLWLFLITGPHTSPIPGLSRAGRASMAEELGWELEGFDKAFGEAFREGMVKADFKARLVWVPKAIRHNRPESPNVVRSWGAEFDLLPECDLKREAYETLKAFISALGEAFAKAFDEAFAKPSGKPSPKPYVKAMPNQEQEQEQQQEQKQEQEEESSLRSESSSASAADRLSDQGEKPEAEKPKLELTPPSDLKAKKSERLRQVTVDAITAYNAVLGKPNGLLAAVNPKVGLHNRMKDVDRCVRVAREICGELYRAAVITPEFWQAYFGQCAEDEHKSGRLGGGPGHENWLPSFEYLTREDVMLAMFDKATSEVAA